MSEDDAALDGILTQGVDALGLRLTAAQRAQLIAHVRLVAQWTQVYNLTAVTDPRQMLRHHVLDSLASVPPLLRQLRSAKPTLLDVGSGAGFPGVPLAVALPHWQVTCVDTVGKKMAFVQQAQAALGVANLRAVHARVERLAPLPWDVIVSRAFASLADFTRWTEPLLAHEGCWMAMKGHVHADELKALPASIEVFHVEQLAVPGLDAARCLVWMRRAGGA